VCAAIRNRAGRIICSARHFDPLMRAQINYSIDGAVIWRNAEQGFIDQRGNFLTREHALEVALTNGQLRKRCGGDSTQLFSENLY
jgi:hypothetical protein